MANRDNPHGFGPLNRSLAGGPGAAAFECSKLAATGALFIGDALIRVAASTRKTPAVGPATAAGPFWGVSLQYAPAAIASNIHLVIPSGNLQMFELQDNDDVTGITQGNATKNANLTTATAGSASTQLSGMELDIASVATTNTLGLRMHGLLQDPNNDFGPHARVIVTFNKNEEADQSAGVLDVAADDEKSDDKEKPTPHDKKKHEEEPVGVGAGSKEDAHNTGINKGGKK